MAQSEFRDRHMAYKGFADIGLGSTFTNGESATTFTLTTSHGVQLNPKAHIIGILITRWEGSKLSKGIEEKLREAVGDIVFNSRIRKNIRLAEAPLESRSILDYDKNCNGAKDYLLVAEEFLNRMTQV